MTKNAYIERAEYFEMKAREAHDLSDNVQSAVAICRLFQEAQEYERLAAQSRARAEEMEAA